MRIKVTHDIDDLASDMARIPVRFAAEAPRVVKRHVELGNLTAQRFARSRSGPHGAHYYKRLTSEMTGLLSGEYGPHGDPAKFVGAGYGRGHGPNLDLPNSADIVAPKFAKAVVDLVDDLFWGG